MVTVWVAGFEPAISCSRSRRSGRTELHPGEVATTRGEWTSGAGFCGARGGPSPLSRADRGRIRTCYLRIARCSPLVHSSRWPRLARGLGGATVWAAGFEPAISCSRNRRSGQAELCPNESRDDQGEKTAGLAAIRRSRELVLDLAGRGRWSRTSPSGSQCSPLCIRRGWSRRESNPHLSGFNRALDHRAAGPVTTGSLREPYEGERSPPRAPPPRWRTSEAVRAPPPRWRTSEAVRAPPPRWRTSEDIRAPPPHVRRGVDTPRASSGSCTRIPRLGRPGPYCWTMLAIPIRARVRGLVGAPRWGRGPTQAATRVRSGGAAHGSRTRLSFVPGRCRPPTTRAANETSRSRARLRRVESNHHLTG